VAEILVMNVIRASIAGALALALLSVGAAAQTPPAPGGRPAPVTPSETKQFGDWLVRCYPVSTPSPCDMFQLLANKQSQSRILSISIAYVPSSDKHVIQVAVPLGVSLAKGLLVTSDTYTSPLLHYRRCDRGGCYIEMLMQNDVVNALGGGTTAKVTVYGAGGKGFDIPFSLKGFADAHGAMTDLARKKTGKGGAEPAPAAPAPAAAPAPVAPAPADAPAPTP
jgi:invasion protein IalB